MKTNFLKPLSIVHYSLSVLILASCSPNDPTPTQPYDSGVIVINAGNFTDNNGTLSLLKREDKTATYDIFQKENMRSLSGSLSGYAEANEKGIILVDNSSAGKDAVEIVDAHTFKSIATIGNGEIENPRNVVKATDKKAYITCWDVNGDFSNFFKNPGYVAVIDLTTNKLVKKITVENSAESIVIIGSEAYVGSSGAYKSTISVIDINTDTVKQTVNVGSDPEVIGVDANNKLWLYAGGKLVKFNTSSKTAEASMTITSSNKEKSPSSFVLSADKKSIIFSYSFYDAADNWKQKGETYSFSIGATTISAEKPFINRLFSGVAVDAKTGNVYAGLTPSYKQAGYVFRYKSDGVLIDSVKAEIAPSKFFFK